MTQQWTLPAWAVLAPVVVGLVLLLAVLLVGVRARRAEQRALATGAEVASLRDALGVLEQQLRAPTTARPAAPAPPAPAPRPDTRPDYVITRIGDEPEQADRTAVEPARVVAAPLFADLVLRESVVQAASLAAGVRRAMAPEVRHRVRLEMKRDVKRARKQRRADLRAARRDWEARRRAEVAAEDPGLDEGSAA